MAADTRAWQIENPWRLMLCLGNYLQSIIGL